MQKVEIGEWLRGAVSKYWGYSNSLRYLTWRKGKLKSGRSRETRRKSIWDRNYVVGGRAECPEWSWERRENKNQLWWDMRLFSAFKTLFLLAKFVFILKGLPSINKQRRWVFGGNSSFCKLNTFWLIGSSFHILSCLPTIPQKSVFWSWHLVWGMSEAANQCFSLTDIF